MVRDAGSFSYDINPGTVIRSIRQHLHLETRYASFLY